MIFIFAGVSAVEPTSSCEAFHSSIGFLSPKFCNFLPYEKSETDTHQIFLWIGFGCTQQLWDILHTHNYCIAYWPPKWNLKGGWTLCNLSRGLLCMEGKVCIKEYSPSFSLYWVLCTIQAVWSTCKRSQEIKQLLRQDQVPLVPFYFCCNKYFLLGMPPFTFVICSKTSSSKTLIF